MEVLEEIKQEAPMNNNLKMECARILSECIKVEYDPKFNTYSQKECIICLDEFAPRATIRILGCRHIFHDNCIEGWIKSDFNINPKCPSCGNDLLNSKPIDLQTFRKKISPAEIQVRQKQA